MDQRYSAPRFRWQRRPLRLALLVALDQRERDHLSWLVIVLSRHLVQQYSLSRRRLLILFSARIVVDGLVIQCCKRDLIASDSLPNITCTQSANTTTPWAPSCLSCSWSTLFVFSTDMRRRVKQASILLMFCVSPRAAARRWQKGLSRII